MHVHLGLLLLLRRQHLDLPERPPVLLPDAGLAALRVGREQVQLVAPEVLGDVGLRLQVAPTQLAPLLLERVEPLHKLRPVERTKLPRESETKNHN